MHKEFGQSAVLVGVGSIGKKHLEIISGKFNSITVIDSDVAVYKYLSDLPYFNRINYLSNITQLKSQSRINLAVISNWGPDHYDVFLKLAKIGVKNYIIEKPLTDSFYELNEMQQLINSMNLTVKTNLPILYSDVPRRLLDFEKTYGIGRPRSMIVYGGAKCIATIGIHYVALANYLYNNRPSAVSAVLRSHRINPRNDKLVYLEGGAQWVYPHDQYLSINFSNTSQLDFKCSILYKNAEVVIHNQNLVLNKISSQDLLLLDKPTKTSSASETILDLSVNTQEDFMRSLHSIYESFTKTESSLDGKWGFAATYDLLSALTANKLQRVIRLPLDKNLIEHYYQKKWGIS